MNPTSINHHRKLVIITIIIDLSSHHRSFALHSHLGSRHILLQSNSQLAIETGVAMVRMDKTLDAVVQDAKIRYGGWIFDAFTKMSVKINKYPFPACCSYLARHASLMRFAIMTKRRSVDRTAHEMDQLWASTEEMECLAEYMLEMYAL